MNDVDTNNSSEKLYNIKVEDFESKGYSFSYSLYNRMSEEGKNEADNLFDGIPTDISLASEFMKIISEKCSKNDQYVLPGTAISEAIFRILIANQNQPMSILDIHSKLANVWSSVIYLKNLSETVVIRVMEGDNQYGFSSE
jgi:hypothetical protein|tara:strand:- start:590 stop:1012 length:423 start_codon:yes stop_codon:yes gene_type:complete